MPKRPSRRMARSELYRLLLVYMLLDNKQLDAAEAAYAELAAQAPRIAQRQAAAPEAFGRTDFRRDPLPREPIT